MYMSMEFKILSQSLFSDNNDQDDDDDPGTVQNEFRNGDLVADMNGMTLLEFIEHTKVKGRRGLYEEYAEIKSRTGPRSQEEFNRFFNTCCNLENTGRNRYTDVHCYDHSRVKLGQPQPGGQATNTVQNDYINANFVDGYRQSSAFI